MNKILNSNTSINRIYNPSNDQESILLKNYLIPLIDLLNTIHPDSTLDYNIFIYDYLFNTDILQSKYSTLYIYHNPFNSNSCIYKLNLNQTLEYMSQYCFTINGCFFNKHEDKLGMFTNIIKDLVNMRKSYKKQRDEQEEGSYKYTQLDMLQSSIKVATNSIYGIFGLSTFKYSSHYLAQSITSQGKLINKLAQYIADQYLILNR